MYFYFGIVMGDSNLFTIQNLCKIFIWIRDTAAKYTHGRVNPWNIAHIFNVQIPQQDDGTSAHKQSLFFMKIIWDSTPRPSNSFLLAGYN